MGMRQPYKVHAKFTQDQWTTFNSQTPNWLREVYRSAGYFEEFDQANPERKIIVQGEDGLVYVTLAGHCKEADHKHLYKCLHDKCEGYTFLIMECDGDYPVFYECNYGRMDIQIEGYSRVVFDGEGLELYEPLSSLPETDIVSIGWHEQKGCNVVVSLIRDIYLEDGSGYGGV